MQPSLRRSAYKAAASLGVSVALLASAALSSASAADPGTFEFVRDAVPPLRNSQTWVLTGKKLADGGCQYRYPMAGETAIPADGWALRVIAVDMSRCRKLMEEGTPTQLPDASGLVAVSDTIGGSEGTSVTAAAASTKGAWLFLGYRDIANLLLTADVTQINWTYNGSTVSGGSATGVWKLFTPTNWQLDSKSLTQLYGPGNSYYRGQTTSTMSNDICPGDQLTYTKYFYNRVWGHPNGTATRSYSTDAVNECLPFFLDMQSGYGQYSG